MSKNTPKLSAVEIVKMIAEKEAEMAREIEREKLNKSLRRLLKKAVKMDFHLNKVSCAHMVNETERFCFYDWGMHV